VADEHTDHRRSRERCRVPADRPTGVVKPGQGTTDVVGALAVDVELVAVAGRDPERPGSALATGEQPGTRATDRRPRPPWDVDGLWVEDSVLDADLVA
jgi:hypothetical protein